MERVRCREIGGMRCREIRDGENRVGERLKMERVGMCRSQLDSIVFVLHVSVTSAGYLRELASEIDLLSAMAATIDP